MIAIGAHGSVPHSLEDSVSLADEAPTARFDELHSLEQPRCEVPTTVPLERAVGERALEPRTTANLFKGKTRWLEAMALCCLVFGGMVIMVSVFLMLQSGGRDDKRTEAPSNVPSMTPTDLTPTDSSNCFNSRRALFEAVDAYLLDSSDTSVVALERGWPIGAWCVGRIRDFSDVFARSRNRLNAAFNKDISSWDVSQGTDFTRCFEGTRVFNNTQLANWDLSRATSLQQMFQDSLFDQPMGPWNVSKVRNFEALFLNATRFNQDLNEWDMSGATSLKQMFQQAVLFKGDISAWDVSKAINFEQMFLMATDFNGDLSSWNVSSVTDMSSFLEVAMSFHRVIYPSGMCRRSQVCVPLLKIHVCSIRE